MTVDGDRDLLRVLGVFSDWPVTPEFFSEFERRMSEVGGGVVMELRFILRGTICCSTSVLICIVSLLINAAVPSLDAVLLLEAVGLTSLTVKISSLHLRFICTAHR
jgi:hypothetical protein